MICFHYNNIVRSNEEWNCFIYFKITVSYANSSFNLLINDKLLVFYLV